MFGEQVIILCYVFIIEIGDTKIKHDGQYERKIENREIGAIAGRTNLILNSPIETQNKNGFYEQVHNKQKSKVRYKFLLHQVKIKNLNGHKYEILRFVFCVVKLNHFIIEHYKCVIV